MPRHRRPPANRDLAGARGNRELGEFRRLCDLVERRELGVYLWTARAFGGDESILILRVSDGAGGSSSAKALSAAALDAAATDVLGQLAMAGIE